MNQFDTWWICTWLSNLTFAPPEHLQLQCFTGEQFVHFHCNVTDPWFSFTSSDQLYDCPRATEHGTKRNLKKPPKNPPSQSRPSQLCNLLCWLCGHPQKLVTPNQVCENQWKPTGVAHVDVAETNKVWSNQWKPFEQMHLCSQISGNWPSQQVLTLQSNACTDCSNWW